MTRYSDTIRRLAPGKSLQTIATGSGIGENSLYRWDKGITPNLVALAKVANYLNIDYRLLLPDQDEVIARANRMQHRRKRKAANHG